MQPANYAVISHQGQWMINISGNNYGPFPTQKEAIRRAIDTAHKAGEQGHKARVMVQMDTGQFRTEWTHGQDPFPPTL